MEKRRKTSVRVCIGIAAVLLLILLLVFGRNNERGIVNFVKSNQVELEEISNDCLNGLQTSGTYKGITVEGVYSGEHRIVQFCSGSAGLVPSSTYFGFYYSEDDVPAAFQNVDMELTPIASNEWEWSDGTDNGGLTKRITAHWFYYKAWF